MAMPAPMEPEGPLRIEWTLGDRIHKARRLLGLEQTEFAELFNVTGAAVSTWETDRSKPRDLLGFAKRLEAVAAERGYFIPETWLLTGQGGSYGDSGNDRWLESVPTDYADPAHPELPFPPTLALVRDRRSPQHRWHTALNNVN